MQGFAALPAGPNLLTIIESISCQEWPKKNMKPDSTQTQTWPQSQPTGPTVSVDLDAFAWTYAQKSGELQQDGKPVATGYSGAGAGKNNPALENLPNAGPT